MYKKIIGEGGERLYYTNKKDKELCPCMTCPITYNPIAIECSFGTIHSEPMYDATSIREWMGSHTSSSTVDLFIVGDYPATSDTLAHRPLYGHRNKLIREVVEVSRKSVCLSYAVLCRPLQFHTSDIIGYPTSRPPTLTERANCSPLVKQVIKYAKPKSILLMGRTAFTSFLPELSNPSVGHARIYNNGIPKFKWLDIPVYVTWSPGYVETKGGVGTETYYEFIDDVAKALKGKD